MKYIHRLSIRIIVTIIVGFLLASAGTKITYSCPLDGAAGCVSFAKAIVHPNDLLNNKQDSLIHFSEVFVASSLFIFAVLSFVSVAQKKPKPAAQPKG